MFFDKHLPYRISALLAHYRMAHDKAGRDIEWQGADGQLTACFLASLVTGRLFLNVMGVGKSGGQLIRHAALPTDVNAEDLGGKFIDLSALAGDARLFLDFIVMADKAAAHFTMLEPHHWQKTHEVIGRICRYMKKDLFDEAGRRSVGIERQLATIGA